MPRPRYRVCLQDGLKLDLNQLVRKGFIKPGAKIGARGISWSSSHRGAIASGVISADMTDPCRAWFQITIGGHVQRITLEARARHHGGHQWYFVCPVTHRIATVLWNSSEGVRVIGISSYRHSRARVGQAGWTGNQGPFRLRAPTATIQDAAPPRGLTLGAQAFT
jgi:hypothetical protein